jgi:glucose/arabinose dehydrogenase
VGVTVAPDGALLVSDDSGNRIWRIAAANAALGR